MKDRNPVDSIRFYSKFNDRGNEYRAVDVSKVCVRAYNFMVVESFTIPKQQVSYMIPSTFEEVAVRIFTRNPQKITAIQKAFRRLIKKITPANSSSQPNAALTLPNDYESVMLAKRRRSTSAQSFDGQVVKKWSPGCK